MEFSKDQEGLVKASWEMMRPNVSELSLEFFTKIFELAPAAQGMFYFMNDSDEIPRTNPRLLSPALKVFKMTCESAIQLREKGEVVVAETTLRNLGYLHLQKGVLPPHFEVVKEALPSTIHEAVGDQWNEEMGRAWGLAYDQLASAIKAEMKEDANQTI